MKEEKKSLSDIPLSTGETLKELLLYEEIPSWWLVDVLINIDLNIDIWRQRYIFKLIHQFLIDTFPKSIVLSSFVSKLLYGSIECINGVDIKKEGNRKYSLLLTPVSSGRWIKIGGDYESGSKLKNPYYDDIYSLLSSNIDILTIYSSYPFPDTFNKYFKITKKYTYPITALMNCWEWDIGHKIIKAISHYKMIYARLEKDIDWLDKISDYTGKNVNDILNVLKYHITCLLPYRIEYYLLLDRMISRIKPNVLFLVGEQTADGRCWIYIGRKYGIPVIALQHGLILSDDPTYLHHHVNDIAGISPPHYKSLLSFPIPNLTLVWGKNEYKLLLTKAGYSPNQLEIVGNPRYDKLSHVFTLYSKEVFCRKYGININNRLILWPTQSHGHNLDETIEYIHEIFTAITEIQNITLIIKPHPAEGNTYIEIIREYLKSYDLNALIMKNDTDTTEQIFISDLVIIKNTTVGQEAVAMHKPIIILDYSAEPDAGKYAAEGVAKGIYKKGLLKDAIIKLLNDDREQEIHRSTYIEKYMHKIDGLSAKRCADIITSFVADDAK